MGNYVRVYEKGEPEPYLVELVETSPPMEGYLCGNIVTDHGSVVRRGFRVSRRDVKRVERAYFDDHLKRVLVAG